MTRAARKKASPGADPSHASPESTHVAPAYPVIRISSWQDFQSVVVGPKYRNWAFRGQAHEAWPLLSSLSRHFQYSGVHQNAWPVQEERILRIFRRKAHLFLQHIPDEEDSFQWLGLMQHHGAPTRLLDLTWSPYVALFFALEQGADTAVVWGLNAGALNAVAAEDVGQGINIDLREVGSWQPGSYERHFLRGNEPFVIVGEPKIMNRRLIAQSGTFAIPGVLNRPMDQILLGYRDPARLLAKFVLDVPAMRQSSLEALYNMNITNATLFPDLDGLAKSMAYELEFHWAFDPRTMSPHPDFPAPNGVPVLGRKDT